MPWSDAALGGACGSEVTLCHWSHETKKDDITTSWCWHFDVHLDTLFPAPPDSIENMDDLGRTLGETLGNPIHMILMLKADGLPSTDQGQKLS